MSSKAFERIFPNVSLCNEFTHITNAEITSHLIVINFVIVTPPTSLGISQEKLTLLTLVSSTCPFCRLITKVKLTNGYHAL